MAALLSSPGLIHHIPFPFPCPFGFPCNAFRECFAQIICLCLNPPLPPTHSSYPSCSGARAPGLAADMHFKDDVIAFIGPACAFALEPVARLAAYWNTPIITGMGDQVSETSVRALLNAYPPCLPRHSKWLSIICSAWCIIAN